MFIHFCVTIDTFRCAGQRGSLSEEFDCICVEPSMLRQTQCDRFPIGAGEPQQLGGSNFLASTMAAPPAIEGNSLVLHLKSIQSRQRADRQESLEIVMLGNLAEKSFERSAILTATRRATCLYSPAISPSGSPTTLGRPLSACTRMDRFKGSAPR